MNIGKLVKGVVPPHASHEKEERQQAAEFEGYGDAACTIEVASANS